MPQEGWSAMPDDPRSISERGEQIYETKYRAELEAKHRGMYAAIEIHTEAVFVEATPEAAIEAGVKANPSGAFHLIRIGSRGVYRVGYSSCRALDGDWLFQR